MGLFPRHDRYFELFASAAEEGERVATAFAEMAADEDDGLVRAKQLVADYGEREGITPAAMSELEQAFVTPFDREDILALAYEHDDTVAELVTTADLMVLHGVEDRLAGFAELGAVVARAMANVGSGLRDVRELESASFARLSLRVTSLVEEGRRLGRCMTADLLRPGDGQPNGRSRQWETVLRQTEAALLHLQRSGRLLETALVKYL